MNRRGILAIAVVTTCVVAAPAWADHSTPIGINCSNFQFQEDAQAYFEAHPGDPEGLDGPAGPATSGVPNLACEDLPPRATRTTVATIPSTTAATVPTTVTSGSPTEAPAAVLSAASGQVTGELGSFCWPQREGTTACRIVDYAEGQGPNPATSLPVTQGETLTLRFETSVPVATLRVAGPDGAAIAAPTANPSRFTVNLPPGTYVINVNATFQVPDGRGSYAFKVVVVKGTDPVSFPAPAPPTPRRIALTG